MKDILKFSRLLETFKQVERATPSFTGSKRRENDAEHSYELAMLAWYLIDSQKLKLDKAKVLQYALCHDLIEVHAGDTWFFSKDKKEVSSKMLREKKAAAKLKKDFPQFKSLHEMIHTYEEREDKESRFVYALDKIHPIIKIYFDNGSVWKERKVSFEMLMEGKISKVAVSPEVKEIFDQLVKILKKNRKKLFPF